MSKSILFTLVILFCFVLAGQGEAQVVTKTVKRKPLFVIEANGGIDLAMMDLRGDDLGGVWNFSNYGQKTGFGFELKFKLSVLTRKMSQLRPYFTIGFTQFKNEDNKVYITQQNISPGWPGVGFNGSGTYTPNSPAAGSSQFVMNIPSAALGLEYAVYTDKKNRSSFNFGLDFPVSVIFGQHSENYASSGQSVNYDMQPNVRVGVGINTVYNIQVAPVVGLNAGLRYQLMNLIGKEDKATGENGQFYLLDAGDGALNSNLSSSRNIGSLRFFVGVSFFIGKR